MSDTLDAAQAEADRIRDAALQRHKAIMAQDARTPSAVCCATCGDRIPDPRRKAVPGTQHCVHCAKHIVRGAR